MLEKEVKPRRASATHADTVNESKRERYTVAEWRSLDAGCVRLTSTKVAYEIWGHQLPKGGLYQAHTRSHALCTSASTQLTRVRWSAFVCVSMWNWSSSRRLRKVASSAAHAERSSTTKSNESSSLIPTAYTSARLDVWVQALVTSPQMQMCALPFSTAAEASAAQSAQLVGVYAAAEQWICVCVCRCKMGDYVSLLFPHTLSHTCECSASFCNHFDSNHKVAQNIRCPELVEQQIWFVYFQTFFKCLFGTNEFWSTLIFSEFVENFFWDFRWQETNRGEKVWVRFSKIFRYINSFKPTALYLHNFSLQQMYHAVGWRSWTSTRTTSDLVTLRQFRQFRVAFVPKAGRSSHVTAKDFRSISISSFLLKTLEILMNLYIRGRNPRNRLLSTQHAYSKGRSIDTGGAEKCTGHIGK